MIQHLRAALVLLALLFTYFFGATLEKFLLEVIRFFVAVQPSNALLFNGVHLVIAVTPLFLLGFIVAVSFGGEPALTRELWSVISGVILGLIAYRIYQLWWIFRGGGGAMGDEQNVWEESISLQQLYFFEKILPYIIVGAVSVAVVAFFEKGVKKAYILSIFSASSSFFWLLITRKIQNIEGVFQMGSALFVTVISGIIMVSIIKSIMRLFKDRGS